MRVLPALERSQIMQIKRVLELDLSGSKSYKSTSCLCGRCWETLGDAECHVGGLSIQHRARVPLLTLTESSSSADANKMNPESMQTPPSKKGPDTKPWNLEI